MAHIVSRTGIGKPAPSAPLFLDVAGPVNFDSTLTVGGPSTFTSLISLSPATNIIVLETRVPSEANPTWTVLRDGTHSWGPGGITATDLTLYRSGTSTLRTSGSFTVDQNVVITGDLSVGGNTVLGSAITDTVAITARLISSILPLTATSVDVGSGSLPFRDLFIGRNAVIGTSSADTVQIIASVNSSLIPLTDATGTLGDITHRWNSLYLSNQLTNSGNTTLGDATTDVLIVNARLESELTPSSTNTRDLGSTSLRWRDLYLSGVLDNSGNTVIGSTSLNTVTFNALVNSDLVPSAASTYSLGSALLPWLSVYSSALSTTGDLTVDGNTVLGSDDTDYLVINAGIDSDLLPFIDNVYSVGDADQRWSTLNTGPAGLVVRNDTISSQLGGVSYVGTGIQLTADASSDISIKNGLNTGIYVDLAGLVGINKNSGLAYQLDVDGTFGSTDTIYANKALGVGLEVVSDVTIGGTLEASSSATLNIGTTTATEFVNIATGSGVQTLNLGTGPGVTVINIGGAGDVVNINGTANFFNTINSSVADKTFVLNAGGAASSGAGAGFFVEEAAVATLVSTDAEWQTGNIVRYYLTNTGNITGGSRVVITGFANSSNNGSFTVQSVLLNTHIDVVSTRTNATDDETGATADVTNPTLVGGFYVNPSRDGWALYAPTASANLINFVNQGSDASIIATATGELRLVSGTGTIIPSVSGADLGTASLRWDLFGGAANVNSLAVNGNTTLGTNGTNTLTSNAVVNFVNGISSHLIPTTGTQDIGSSVARWRDVWASGSIAATGGLSLGASASISLDLTVGGDTTLGDASTDSITLNGQLASSIVPNAASTFDLGSPTNSWANIYADTFTLPGASPGNVVFVGPTGNLTEESDFFWDSVDNKLGIGTNSPVVQLDVVGSAVEPSMRLFHSSTLQGFGMIAGTTTVAQYTTLLEIQANTAANLGVSFSGTPAVRFHATGRAQFMSAIGLSLAAVPVTSNTYSVLDTDTVIRVDTSNVGITANCDIALPSAAIVRMLVIKDAGGICSQLNKNILLTPQSGEFVEFGAASASYIMDTDGMSITLHSDGVSRWWII